MDITDQHFEEAVEAIVSGQITSLKKLLEEHPKLVYQSSSKAHQASLLHYLMANGVEDERQIVPENAVDIGRLLLTAGANPDALAAFGGNYGENTTPLICLVSSYHPYKAGLQADLVDLLLDYGAEIEGLGKDGAPLATAIAFGYTDAVDTLIKRGAKILNPQFAAGAGDLSWLKKCLESDKWEFELFQGPSLKSGESDQEQLNWSFIYACMHHRLDAAAYLLSRGADIGSRGHQGMTAMHYACARNHHQVFRFLLEHDAPLEVKNDYGGTVLDYLVWEMINHPGNPEMRFPLFHALIYAGAELKAVDPIPERHKTLKMELDFHQAVQFIQRGDISRLKLLLKSTPSLATYHSIIEIPPHNGYFMHPALIHYIAGNPDWGSLPANLMEILQVLLEAGAEVDAVCGKDEGWKWSCLGLVASSGQALKQSFSYPLIDQLLEAGADIDFDRGLNMFGAFFHTPSDQGLREVASYLFDKGGQQDLCYAAVSGKIENCRLFFEEDGSLKPDAYTRYRLFINRKASVDRQYILNEALAYACLNGRIETTDFLIEKGAELQSWSPINEEILSPLHAAVWGNWMELTIHLLELGANPNLRDPRHNSSAIGWADFLQRESIKTYLLADPSRLDLDNAIEFEQLALARAIIEKHPEQVNGQGGRGAPIRIVANNGNLELARALLASGADPNIKGVNGKTALDYAYSQGYGGIVELLRQYGGESGGG